MRSRRDEGGDGLHPLRSALEEGQRGPGCSRQEAAEFDEEKSEADPEGRGPFGSSDATREERLEDPHFCRTDQGSVEDSIPAERKDVSLGSVQLSAASPVTRGEGLGEIADRLLDILDNVMKRFKPLHGPAKNSGGIFPLPDTLAVLQQSVGDLGDEPLKDLLMMCQRSRPLLRSHWTQEG